MVDKEALKSAVKEWIDVERESKVLSKELSVLRLRRKELTVQLADFMQKHNIDDLAVGSDKLVYSKRKTRAPLSKKHLLQSLSMYFKDNEDIVAELGQHILDSRDVKIVDTIQKK
jgi:TPP-dependent 2-oxoacid decarboxylase